jgi:hypothetical protein
MCGAQGKFIAAAGSLIPDDADDCERRLQVRETKSESECNVHNTEFSCRNFFHSHSQISVCQWAHCQLRQSSPLHFDRFVFSRGIR